MANRKLDSSAEETFKNFCYPFYNKKTKTYKRQTEVKEAFLCKLTQRNQRNLYAKNDDFDRYDFFPQTKLQTYQCIGNYGNYLDPERKNDGFEPLKIDDLLTGCSETIFDFINTDFKILQAYSYNLQNEIEKNQGVIDQVVKNFIDDLIKYTNIDKKTLDEIYKGGFVIVRDNGYFYKTYGCHEKGRICKLDAFPSESSHDSQENQYRLGNGMLMRCNSGAGECDKNNSNSTFDLLIGKSPIENFYGDTWFQFEYANITTWTNKWPLHGYSYIKHKLTGHNVGPLGTSEYAEYTKCIILDMCYDNCNPKIDVKCEPVSCVSEKINLFEYSQNFFSANNILLEKYKLIKDYVKTSFTINSKTQISDILSSINGYLENSNSPDFFSYGATNPQLTSIFKAVEPFLQRIADDNYYYNRDQIIEILFLIFYYITCPEVKSFDVEVAEVKEKINRRYDGKRSTERGGRNKTRKNKKRRRSTIKNNRFKYLK
jgi:hypothetical protein